MGCLLNILWHFPFFGFLFALGYAIFGVIMCCTVILMPLGLGWLQMAKFMLSPFSYALVSRSDYEAITGEKQHEAYATFSLIIRILYLPFGCIGAVCAIPIIACEFVSIVGIPCAMVWTKLFKSIFNPVGKVCVPKAVGDEIERRKAAEVVSKYTGQSANSNNNNSQLSDIAMSLSRIIEKQDAVQDLRPERPQIRTFDDSRLAEIVNNPDMYNAELVTQCHREIEIRSKSESMMEKVIGFDDGKLREIMADTGMYADELVYCCQKEYDRRAQVRREELEIAQELARLEREQEAEAKRAVAAAERERRILWWKKWRILICSVVLLIIAASVGGYCWHVKQEQERIRQEQILAEQLRREEMERRRLIDQLRLEEQQRIEREKREAEARRRAQQRQEAKRQAEIARKDMEERHKKGIYRIGEYYEVDSVRGIVFSTTDDGIHGMVISLEQGEEMSWDRAYGSGRPNNKLDWSLPTIEEMTTIMENKSIINKALANAGVPIIGDRSYWLKNNRNGIVYYCTSDSRIHNCTKTDVRSQPYRMSARWVSKY